MSLSRQFQQAAAAGTQLLRGQRAGRAAGLADLVEAEVAENARAEVVAHVAVSQDPMVLQIVSLIDDSQQRLRDEAEARAVADAERASAEAAALAAKSAAGAFSCLYT